MKNILFWLIFIYNSKHILLMPIWQKEGENE